MPSPDFIHLRLHSEYSVVDGIVRLDDAVARARSDGMPALALTDLGNLFGLVKFYRAARAAGVKPVIGCDLWLSNDDDREKPFRVLLLVQDHDGYLRLCRWLTRAYRENQYRGRAEVRRSWFEHDGTDGLIALSGGPTGEVANALLTGHEDRARQIAREWATLFPGRFYIELQRAGNAEAEACEAGLLRLASALRLPPVATHPVQFLEREQFTAHEARVCIAESHVLADQRRPRRFTEEQYFKSRAEMVERFADLPAALRNSVEIAQRCNLALELGKSRLPLFPTPAGQGLDDYLREQALIGLGLRMVTLFPDAALRDERQPVYRERLDFEIRTIVQMGFPGYFLIVADFINWAKNNGVPVGPGRGSGAGSLVAYALGITDLDPLRYDLLFERFLNPERVSMPDFDVDFCQEGRDRVIDYVRGRYGDESVSQIVTFGTMAAKAVVRDVGRVMEWSYGRTDELAKLIPFQPGKLITLEMAREMEPRLRELEQKDEETRNLLALAAQLEGVTRNVGMHAGGVLIAPGKLTDFCPLYLAPGSDSPVSQFDKDDVEAIGLVKFDFLGLTTLTILDWTLRFVRLLDPASTLQLETLPLDDREAYRIFATGNTTAVFQFESRGMRELLTRARPDRFEDIIALVALYRPGPMELIPDYIERKQGKRFDYLHPTLVPVLEPTYGIMVYQEQVMQAAQVCAGYSLGGADLLRRAMGKKKPEEMAQQRTIFVDGAAGRGIEAPKANEIFDYMEKFAGYGFNKSHAAAYALVAYHTAYFKAHHPAAFMAANLSALMGDTDKLQQFYDDAKANSLKILPPDVNTGDYRFVPVDALGIRYGLGAIKGTGEAAIASILRARDQDGPFRDLLDFCARVEGRLVNRRVIESLIKAGAFDGVDHNRARLLASVGIAMGAAEQATRNANQSSLFGGAGGPPEAPPALPDTPPWNIGEKLQHERAALGFYLSGHPFMAYAREFEQIVRAPLARLAPPASDDGGKLTVIAGVIDAVRFQKTQQGRMMVLMLSDGTGSQEVTVYDEVAGRHRELVREDAVVVIEAKIRTYRRSNEDGESIVLRVAAERLYSVAAARARFARSLELSMNGEANARKLRQLLEPFRQAGDSCPVSICYRNREASVDVRLGDDWRVVPDDKLIRSLSDWLSPENVRFVYQ